MKINLRWMSVAAVLAASSLISPVYADEGKKVLENHAFRQIVGNPDSPFTNHYIHTANTARNYFAVAHPSLKNYLEVVGGSNFYVLNDNNPDWHNTNCVTNLPTGQPSLDDGKHKDICPIRGTGTDAATPVIDFSN